jgi:hypothetical protein
MILSRWGIIYFIFTMLGLAAYGMRGEGTMMDNELLSLFWNVGFQLPGSAWMSQIHRLSVLNCSFSCLNSLHWGLCLWEWVHRGYSWQNWWHLNFSIWVLRMSIFWVMWGCIYTKKGRLLYVIYVHVYQAITCCYTMTPMPPILSATSYLTYFHLWLHASLHCGHLKNQVAVLFYGKTLPPPSGCHVCTWPLTWAFLLPQRIAQLEVLIWSLQP